MDMKLLMKALSKNVGEIDVEEAPLLFQPVGHVEHHNCDDDTMRSGIDKSIHTPHFFHTLEMSNEEVLERMLAASKFTESLHEIHAPGKSTAGCPTCALAERMLQRDSKSKLGLQLLADIHRHTFVKKQQAVEQFFKLVDAFNERTISIIWR
jgi:hypothetical protein